MPLDVDKAKKEEWIRKFQDDLELYLRDEEQRFEAFCCRENVERRDGEKLADGQELKDALRALDQGDMSIYHVHDPGRVNWYPKTAGLDIAKMSLSDKLRCDAALFAAAFKSFNKTAEEQGAKNIDDDKAEEVYTNLHELRKELISVHAAPVLAKLGYPLARHSSVKKILIGVAAGVVLAIGTALLIIAGVGAGVALGFAAIAGGSSIGFVIAGVVLVAAIGAAAGAAISWLLQKRPPRRYAKVAPALPAPEMSRNANPDDMAIVSATANAEVSAVSSELAATPIRTSISPQTLPPAISLSMTEHKVATDPVAMSPRQSTMPLSASDHNLQAKTAQSPRKFK